MGRRRGFTLIELLVVVVVLAVLATIAMARFQGVRERAFRATLESDLRVLSVQEELYQAGHHTYTAATSDLPEYTPSAQSSVTVTHADARGWSAFATHARLPGRRCAIFYGSAPAETPATDAGVIGCDE